MSFFDRWRQRARFWRQMPPLSTALFLTCVFGLFGAVGLIELALSDRIFPAWVALMAAAGNGLIAVVYAWLGTRALLKPLIAWIPAQVLLGIFGARWLIHHASRPLPHGPGFEALHLQVRLDAFGALFLIALSYTCLLVFLNLEGRRYFKTHTEMQLAAELQHALVPPVTLRQGNVEMFAASVASDRFGGDIADVVPCRAGWVAYVADVAGHGVPAGVLMAMVKSAMRTHLGLEPQLEGLLENVNRALCELTAEDRFVTLACLSPTEDPFVLRFALAGHLPILRLCAATEAIEELSTANLPLGIDRQASFQTARVRCQPGDLLAIVTDGFIEVGQERAELGLEALKKILLDCRHLPLGTIFECVRHKVLAFGSQRDDQTMLLLRVLPD